MFQIEPSQNVFRRTRGGGRRPLRSAQGTSKAPVSAGTSSTSNATGQRSMYQVYCSTCRRYVAENQLHRCHGQSEDRSSAAPAASSKTVTAPVAAQHVVSRLQSNSASTAITVTGNNYLRLYQRLQHQLLYRLLPAMVLKVKMSL
jgi:hypothetical protein